MQFLNPVMLFGLAAAAIPVVLHFLSRRRVVEIPFAPLRFLLPTQEKQMRRMSLRRLLILLLRVLIIVCVVLAAARPTLETGPSSLLRGSEGVSAVVLLDDSASMQAEVTGGTVFDRARAEAQQIVRGLGREDEVAVLRFSDVARPVFAEFVRDRDLVAAELDRLEPSARSTDYLAALDGALEFLRRASRPHREIYFVGDLQATDLDSMEVARWQQKIAGEGPVAVYLRAVDQEKFVNRQVVEIERPGTLLRARESTELSVVIAQDGDEPGDVGVFLEVDGTRVAETELSVAPRGLRRHGFPLTLPEAGDLGGSVRLRPDRYPLDDEAFFVLPVSEQVPVLVMRGVAHDEAERDPLLFLLAALDPQREGQGRFAPTVADIRRFDVETLSATPVVVLADPTDMGAARLAALTDYLQGGGTVLLFAGDPRVREYVDERLLPGWTALRLGAFRGSEDVIERLEIVAADHPIFDELEEEALATLGEVRQRNFFRIAGEADRTLLAWAGGGGAVVEAAVGEGRLIVCGFDPSGTAGDLVFSPMFLPLVQRLTGYLATSAWGRHGRSFDVGAPLIVEAPAELAALPAAEWRLVRPDGTTTPATLDASRMPARVKAEPAEVAGLYRVAVDERTVATLAVNVPRSESRRSFWSPDELAALLSAEASPLRFADLGRGDLTEAMAAARQGRPVHMWLLWAAAIFLVLEGLLSRRIGKAA